jgi:hypothetical protein
MACSKRLMLPACGDPYTRELSEDIYVGLLGGVSSGRREVGDLEQHLFMALSH